MQTLKWAKKGRSSGQTYLSVRIVNGKLRNSDIFGAIQAVECEADDLSALMDDGPASLSHEMGFAIEMCPPVLGMNEIDRVVNPSQALKNEACYEIERLIVTVEAVSAAISANPEQQGQQVSQLEP